MATIEPYEIKSGRRYKVQYRTPDRRPTTKRGFKRKKDAELFAAQVETSKADGTFISPTAGTITVSQLHPAWEHGQKQLAPRSQRNNASSWKVHVQPRWGNWPVGRITTPEIRKWVVDLQETKGRDTVLRAVHVLRSILDVAVEERKIKANPAVKIQVKRESRPRRPYLTVAQVDALAAGMEGQYRTLIYVLAYCGPRINEATALQVEDYDRVARRLSITKAVKGPGEIGPTKTYEQRRVPVPRFVAAMLEELVKGRRHDQPLFTSPERSRLDADNYRDRTFKPGLKAAQAAWKATNEGQVGKFPTLTPHSLRHTCASMAISAGANVMAVQKLLGHESAAVTLGIYADLFPDDLDQVADALDDLHARSGQR